MARNILPFVAPARLPRWAGSKTLFSPVSTAASSSPVQRSPALDYLGSAIEFLNKRLTPDRLLSVLDANCDADSALAVLKWACAQKSFKPTLSVYSRVMVKIGVSENLIVKDEERLDLCFGSFIERCCELQKYEDALKVMQVLNAARCNTPPPIFVFNRVLGGLVGNQEWKLVLFGYKEIVKAGIFPNADTLNFLLDALCGLNMHDAALKQYHRMGKKGCTPNSRTFEIILGGLCLKNRVEEAREILREVLNSKVLLDSSFYCRSIALLCRFGWLEDALRLYGRMSASKILPDSMLFAVLIHSCCNNGKVEEATGLFSDMCSLGISPEVDMYVNIVDEYCKLGKRDKAEKFLDEYPAFDCLPYNHLLEDYCNRHGLSEARRYLEKLAKRGLCNVFSWNLLIKVLCEDGLIRRSQEVLGRMVISSHNPDSDTYSALVIGYCKIKQYESALELFAEVRARDYFLSSYAFSELIYNLCDIGKIGEAVEVFKYLSSKGCILNISSLNVLIEKICLIGKVNQAISLRSLAYCSGTRSCSITYATIMDALLSHNETRSMLVLFSQMLVEGCALDMNVYRALTVACCSEKGIAYPSALLNQMLVAGYLPDSETLHAFISCAASNSQLHTVVSILHKIMSFEGAFSPKLYLIVMNGLCIEGHKDLARQFLDKMLELGLLPDPVTHAMLFEQTRVEGRKIDSKIVATPDNVANILADGLSEI